MDYETLVQTRRSVRGFKTQPVPRAVIEEVIDGAKRAPSSMNTDIVHEVADIPEDQVIMTSVAMGYPDDSFPANAVRSDQKPNDDFVRYVRFVE